MKTMKSIIVVAIVALFLGYAFFKKEFSVFSVQEIHFEELNETIYLKYRARGLNYEETIITLDKKRRRKPDIEKDYVYTWDETLFYKNSQDTLYVYCSHKTSTPSEFKSDVVIVQKQYSNPEFVYQFQKNYAEMGLIKFPED